VKKYGLKPFWSYHPLQTLLGAGALILLVFLPGIIQNQVKSLLTAHHFFSINSASH